MERCGGQEWRDVVAGRNGEMLWRAGMERCCGGQGQRYANVGKY